MKINKVLDKIDDLDLSISKLERAIKETKEDALEGYFNIKIIKIDCGYVLKWTKGSTSSFAFSMECRERIEAIDGNKNLMQRIGQILEEQDKGVK